MIEQMLEDFPMEYLSTMNYRVHVRKWFETQSVSKPGWTLSSKDEGHLTQQVIHQQSEHFTYKILKHDT